MTGGRGPGVGTCTRKMTPRPSLRYCLVPSLQRFPHDKDAGEEEPDDVIYPPVGDDVATPARRAYAPQIILHCLSFYIWNLWEYRFRVSVTDSNSTYCCKYSALPHNLLLFRRITESRTDPPPPQDGPHSHSADGGRRRGGPTHGERDRPKDAPVS